MEKLNILPQAIPLAKKKYTAKISIYDPITEEKQVLYKDFFYEVIKSK